MPEKSAPSPQTSQNGKPKKLLDQVSDALRTKHYSYRTEQTYKDWIKRYILFHPKRHPQDMGGPEIQAFLSHLALHENIASSTQNQAAQPLSLTSDCPVNLNML